MEGIIFTLVKVGIGGFLAFLWLRHLTRRPQGTPLQKAEQLSFWTAALATTAALCTGPGTYDLIPAHGPATAGAADELARSLEPALWLAVVYGAGLRLWKQNPGSLNRATTAARPGTLLTVAAALAAAELYGLVKLGAVPGLAPSGSTPGLRSGAELQPFFFTTLGSTVAVCAAFYVVCQLRKVPEGLEDSNAGLLRAMWTNRIIRSAIAVLTGVGAQAIWHAIQAGALDDRALLPLLLPALFLLQRPSSLQFAAPGPKKPAMDKLHRQLMFSGATSSAVAWCGVLALAAGLWAGWLDALPAVWLVAGLALVLLLVQLAFFLHGRWASGQEPAEGRLPLPGWVWAGTGLALVWALYGLFIVDGLSGERWLAAAAVVFLLLAGAGYLWLVRGIRLEPRLDGELGPWFGQVLQWRGVQVVAAALVAVPVGSFAGSWAVAVVALAILMVPPSMVVAVPRRARAQFKGIE